MLIFEITKLIRQLFQVNGSCFISKCQRNKSPFKIIYRSLGLFHSLQNELLHSLFKRFENSCAILSDPAS